MNRNLQPSKELPVIKYDENDDDIGDPEVNHADEDNALWIFVHFVAGQTTNTGIRREAMRFIEWQEGNKGRTRWYA